MKVKTLIKLANIKEKPLDIYINYGIGENYEQEYEFRMDVLDYHSYKDKKIIDWEYIPGAPLENTNDKIIIVV